jgi:hypothetical protein
MRLVQKKLKEKSDDRVQHWPNTLAAQRKAKLDWKVERETNEEAARRVQDQAEAELARKTRVDAIRRANSLMYEQTDRMKFLRSQQLYTDVIADREDQVAFLNSKREALKEDDKKWHINMMENLEEAERREKAEAAKRKSKSKDISEIQQKQLVDTKNQLVKKLKADYVEGQLIKQMTIDDIMEEQAVHAAKLAAAKKQNAEMLKANMNLKDLRKELLKVEEVEAAKRKKDVQNMNRIVIARKALEDKHFEERQAVRQRMIEIATKDLESRKAAADGILEKHHKESEAKYQAEMEARRLRKEKALFAIDMSRQMQIKLKKERRDAETNQASILAEHWKKRNAEIESETQKEANDKWNKNWEIRRSQESQIMDNRRLRAEERASEMLRDEQTKAVMAEDDERFRNFAQIEIDRFKEKGKRTFLLEKARDATDITVMGADVKKK